MCRLGFGIGLLMVVAFVGLDLRDPAIGLGTGSAFAQVPVPKSVRPAAPPAPKRQPSPPAASEPQQSANPNPPGGPGWISKCTSEARQSPVECSMEQTVVLTNTGQLVASIVVRVPTDTHEPVMMIQVPVGLYLPAGINLQIDDGKERPIPLQTCDLKGCYAGTQLDQDLLASLKAGKRLAVVFQNLAKNNVSVPLSLENFAEAYQKIQ